MANLQAEAAKNHRPANSTQGIGPSVNSGEYALAAALALNDTIDLCKLPANEVPVSGVFYADDLDTDGSPAIAFNVGIYDADGDTDDADCFLAASTVGQAKGGAAFNLPEGFKLAPVNYDRIVRATVSTGPATGATSGTVGCNLMSRAAGLDD